MRTFGNHLGDPALHMLAIALILVYLTVCRGPSPDDVRAAAPLPFCNACHSHYLDGQPCDCRTAAGVAHARR